MADEEEEEVVLREVVEEVVAVHLMEEVEVAEGEIITLTCILSLSLMANQQIVTLPFTFHQKLGY